MKKKRQFPLGWPIPLVLFALTLPLPAQVFRGGIHGTVTDPSGAVVAQAAVKAENTATGLIHSTLSSTAGEYSLPDLPLGQYTVTAAASGFQVSKVTEVPVQAGVIYTLGLKLALSSTATTMDVAASAASIDTTSTTQTAGLSEKTVQNVPLNGRDFTQLLALSPGYSGYSVGFLGSINGARPNQINWQIEGADNNDHWINTTATNQGGVYGIAGVVLPLEAVSEFSLVTQAGPETGRNPGGTVNLVIQSGTNQLHGTAYYYNRNEALAARSPFVDESSPNDKLRNEHYGFSAGGPVIRNRTFLFSTFEHQNFVITSPALATEPSQAYQQAAQSLLASYGVASNPVSRKLLDALWPANALTGAATTGNYSNPGAETGYSNNGLLKLDHAFNDSNRVSVRAFVGAGNQTAPTSSYLSPYFEVAPIHDQNWAAIYNATYSPRLTGQTLVGVNYFKQIFSDQTSSYNPVALGLNTGVTSPQLSGAPNIKIGSFDPVGVTPYSGRQDIAWHVNEALSYVVGRHQFRFGGEGRRSDVDEFYHTGQRGTFSFNGSRGPWAGKVSDGNVAALADFLAGDVYQSSIVLGNPARKVYENSFNVFAQDQWQVTRQLNLNYGIRYDYTTPLQSEKKDLSTFIPNQNGLVLAGGGISTLYPADKKNFGPRVGLAWQPRKNGSLVVRAGAGVFYDTISISPFLALSRVANGGPTGVQGNPIGDSPVGTYSKNKYTLPTDGSAIFPSAISVSGSSVYNLLGVSQHFRTPSTYNLHFELQQRLGGAALLQVGYVGSLGRNQLLLVDTNPAAPGSGGSVQARPYYSQYPNYGVINELQTVGSSNYHSLQATLKTSKWHGVVSQLTWGWAHSLDYGTSVALPQNNNDLRSEYGNSTYDVRHNVSAVVAYDIPGSRFGPKWLTAGWATSATFSSRTALPFGLVAYPDFSGTGENTSRPNRIGNPYAGVSHQIVNHQAVQWVTPDAFAYPDYGTFGNLSRNQLRGPDFRDVDLSITKETPITERVSGQLRIELFNVFNRVNLANPTFLGANLYLGGYIPTVGSTMGTSLGLPGIGPGEPFNAQLAFKLRF